MAPPTGPSPGSRWTTVTPACRRRPAHRRALCPPRRRRPCLPWSPRFWPLPAGRWTPPSGDGWRTASPTTSVMCACTPTPVPRGQHGLCKRVPTPSAGTWSSEPASTDRAVAKGSESSPTSWPTWSSSRRSRAVSSTRRRWLRPPLRWSRGHTPRRKRVSAGGRPPALGRGASRAVVQRDTDGVELEPVAPAERERLRRQGVQLAEASAAAVDPRHRGDYIDNRMSAVGFSIYLGGTSSTATGCHCL
jgi:hypothetical protein